MSAAGTYLDPDSIVHEGEGNRRIISRNRFTNAVVDCSSVKSWRSAWQTIFLQCTKVKNHVKGGKLINSKVISALRE